MNSSFSYSENTSEHYSIMGIQDLSSYSYFTTNHTLALLQELLKDDNISAQFNLLSQEDQLTFLQSLGEQFQNEEVQHEVIIMQFVEYRIYKAIVYYLPPLLLFLGTFGNLFAFLILRNKTMTRQSTNLFLATISVADSIVLLVGLLRQWVGELTGIPLLTQADWLCKTVSVLLYSSSHFSVWLIIAVTIERYIVVSHPLHASRFCNVPRAKKVVAFLVVFFILLNLHFMWTVTVEYESSNGHMTPRCQPLPEYQFFVSQIWHWVDAVLYALLPLMLILIFNSMIIRQTVKAKKFRMEFQSGPLLKMEKRKSSNDSNVKLTIMLLCVSFTFCITTVPMAIVMLMTDQWQKDSDHVSLHAVVRQKLVRTIAEMLMYLNHSINFYLYCALGQKFRNQFMRTICGRTASNNSNSDHSQHLYCSRTCKISGYHIHKSTEETAL